MSNAGKWPHLVRSRKTQGCWDCDRLIPAGTLHLVVSARPGYGGITHPTKWTHGRYCRFCCERYSYERELWQQAAGSAAA